LASADPAPGKDLCKDGGYQALDFEDQGQSTKHQKQRRDEAGLDYMEGEIYPARR